MDTRTPDGVVRHGNSRGGWSSRFCSSLNAVEKQRHHVFFSFLSSSVSRMIPRTLALSGNVGMGAIPNVMSANLAKWSCGWRCNVALNWCGSRKEGSCTLDAACCRMKCKESHIMLPFFGVVPCDLVMYLIWRESQVREKGRCRRCSVNIFTHDRGSLRELQTWKISRVSIIDVGTPASPLLSCRGE
jgi:hypothetical protein